LGKAAGYGGGKKKDEVDVSPTPKQVGLKIFQRWGKNKARENAREGGGVKGGTGVGVDLGI